MTNTSITVVFPVDGSVLRLLLQVEEDKRSEWSCTAAGFWATKCFTRSGASVDPWSVRRWRHPAGRPSATRGTETERSSLARVCEGGGLHTHFAVRLIRGISDLLLMDESSNICLGIFSRYTPQCH